MTGKATRAMSGAAHLESILRAYGAAHSGPVTRRQLVSAGVARHVIERRVQSGRLLRVHRGVYRTDAVADTCVREMAAVLACGGDRGMGHGSDAQTGRGMRTVSAGRVTLICNGECRVSHRSAAALLGLSPAPESDKPVEVSMRWRHRRGIPGIRVHRVRSSDPDEVTTVHGLPVTTPARTLLDLGECASTRTLEQALARAERNGQVTREELREMVRRHPRHRGARKLRSALDVDGPQAFTRSRAEELLLALIRKAGLPAPELKGACSGSRWTSCGGGSGWSRRSTAWHTTARRAHSWRIEGEMRT